MKLFKSFSGTESATMSITKKGQSTNHCEHTPQITGRRRSLFPPDTIDSEEESDLGHISPLNFDSDHEDLKYLVSKQPSNDGSLLSKTDSIGDYDVLGVVENLINPVCTPITDKRYSCSDTMSPLYLSPYFNRLNSAPETDINETPCKISPSYNLKTPHDASNTSSKVPKLARKSLLDTLEFTSTKRKLSPFDSPEHSKNKHLKLDPKNSKVRTTLFPEVDISLPTKNFYPKTDNIMEKLRNNRETFSKSPVSYNTSCKVRSKKKVGQINAGVSHKIRKPKQKKLSKAVLAKAVANSNAITEYIKDLTELKVANNEQTKVIENKENANPHLLEQKQITVPKLSENNTHRDQIDGEIDSNKKRSLSPVPEPDPNKKFFKFSRPKGIVTVNKNIKLQVDHGKMTLIAKENKKKKASKIEFDSLDFSIDEPHLPKPNIESILSSLDNIDNEINMEDSSTKIVLQAHNSVTASENSILLHAQPAKCAANLILSPISQMCDVTSGLALNSPKKVKNLTSILNTMPNAIPGDVNNCNKDNSVDIEKQKLFPIFCARSISVPEKKENKVLPRGAKKFRNLEECQMLLDAGQRKFGATQCAECSIVYHMGDPSDENMHLNYHNAGHVLRFAGWKNERVVADFHKNGRVIQILPDDSKIWWKKAKELMDLINRELGCYEMEFSLDNCQVYLYIKCRTIAGCTVAIAKTEGHRMLTTKPGEPDLCSEEVYPIKCGIPRIWVSRNYQRQGIGTALMNVVKKNFMLGSVLSNSDIALSPPTDMGQSFAKSYFKTSNYLIYYV